MPRSWAAATIAAARGCSLARSTLAASRSSLGLVEARGGRDGGDGRLALGQRAGLVDDEGVDPLHPLERFRVPDKHAGLGAAADADHDRHRGGEAQCARAGDDEHGDGGDQPVGEARLGSPDRPCGECQHGDGDHGRHEPGRDLIGESLDRRAAALGLGDERHDLRQHGVAADALGTDDQRAALIERAADDAVRHGLGDGHRLAGHHRFIDGAAALDDGSIDRDLLARPYAQPVADGDVAQGDLVLGAVGADGAGGLRREVEQRADGAAGALPRAQLQHLAEQHEDGDHGGGLEVDRDRAIGGAELGGNRAGMSVANTL